MTTTKKMREKRELSFRKSFAFNNTQNVDNHSVVKSTSKFYLSRNEAKTSLRLGCDVAACSPWGKERGQFRHQRLLSSVWFGLPDLSLKERSDACRGNVYKD